MFGVAFAAVAVAVAQTITVDPGNALEAVPGTFYELGVGAPTVAWDPDRQLYVLFFETQTGPADATCKEGYWSIGMASSADGATWDVWPDPIVSPTPGTAWSCYAAHPAVVRDDDGTYHLWFKAGQGTNACAVSAPAWGCALQPGIGKVEGTIALDGSSDRAALEAELVALESAIEDVWAEIADEALAYEAALAGSAALDCVDYDDVCAPCDATTLTVTHVPGGPSVLDTRTFCQPFDFATPASLPVTSGGSGSWWYAAALQYGTNTASTSCWYAGYQGQSSYSKVQFWWLPLCPTAPADPNIVQLLVQRSSNAFPSNTVSVTLTATNAQALQGPGYDTLLDLADAAAAGDEAGTLAAGDASLVVLDDLLDVLAGLGTTEADDLHADTLAFRDTLASLLAEARDLRDQADLVQAELDGLESFVPTVSFTAPQPGPSLVQAKVSFPTVAKVGGVWTMQVVWKRNVWTATSTDGRTFTPQLPASILYNTVAWTRDELFSPSLVCNDVAGPDRYQAVVGGRDTSNGIPGGPVAFAGIGDAISADAVTWFSLVSAWTTWTTNDAWRHFDVLRDGAQHKIWLSEIDAATGLSVIRTASTGPVAATGGAGRVCP